MEPILDLLRPHAKVYGPALARAAYDQGLVVTRMDNTVIPIPITATPLVLEAREIQRRSDVAALLASAGLKMAQSILRGPSKELLLGALGPLERKVVEGSFESLHRLAITRVDYFVSDRPYALELNATIPAMPAYSDIAAETFIEVVGRHAGLDSAEIAQLQRQNGSNTRALYDALLRGYAAERGNRPAARLAILVRRHDAQLSEIRALAQRFNAWGTETRIVYPDEASRGPEGFFAQGLAFDFVYRHLFVRRLEALDAPYVLDFLTHPAGRGSVLFNGPAAHVETKTTFALLSQSLDNRNPGNRKLASDAGLSEAEQDAVKTYVPWTRTLTNAPGRDPDGTAVRDLTEVVAADPDRYVIKRAWDYGGKAVFIGSGREEAGFSERVRTAYGNALPWRELVARAAKDRVGGGFVVQELVKTPVQEHWIAGEGGLTPVDMYVDYSAYASVNLGEQPGWGGVCRGAPSKIVNILGGGGVLPLLNQEVFSALTARLRSSG